MTRLVAALRREPIRVYLYGVLASGEAVAVSYGLVSQVRGVLWLALGAAVLVVPAAEAARQRSTPTADPRDDAGRALRPVRYENTDYPGQPGERPPNLPTTNVD